MNIKSLLIGSAAALVAVSGARAADAVVIAEPEPVEYVRICDAYGTGFFYIPGTETCLRIDGYVWYQIGAGSYKAGHTSGYYGFYDGWNKRARARINFDARSDTEWGTLRGFIRLQADWPSGSNDTTPGVAWNDGPVGVDQAFIQLGGLMMGYSESFWVDSKNGPNSNYGTHSWGGMYYGYQQRHLIGYRYNGPNGFFAAVSLEDDADKNGPTGRGYVPDVVGKIGIAQGWGTVWARVAYDESYSHDTAYSGGFAAALAAHINVPNMPGSSLRVFAHYADAAHAYNTGGPNYNGLFGGADWNILASYNHQFTSTLGVSVGAQYFNDLYWARTDRKSGVSAWAAEVNVVWVPVENLEVRTEIVYTDVGTVNGYNPKGTVSGYLRFTRYF